ncbi:DUF2283 domain-containing protein [Thermoactinomyces sp. CICC 10521]|uniref:DUF2283 domain-containing protein n=1 Tax=Thermoactinomyces sp. CICC 10521 TaxID=2767426 RepID=UPI0018DD6254|nr:DUF2283 domain-containing protein [Thermoactinomyces sp. CICC 10521]MBH8609108.1 DUF2283 domain-containing protein [Thermoactinomyces sp. CICC 10521]
MSENISTSEQNDVFAYDIEHDILYIFLGAPVKGYEEEILPGVFIRKDEETGKVVGIIVMNSRKERELMSEKIRTNIQNNVCKLLTKLNDFSLYGIPESDVNEIRATLYQILDHLDSSDVMEYTVNRFEHGALQFFMEVY